MNDNKYIKFDLNHKITASLIGLLIVILSLIYFIVAPTIKEIKTMGQAIEAQREYLEKKYRKGQNLKQLTENFKKIEPKLELIDQIFINKNRELEFITSLENEANKSQVSQKINLSAPSKETGPNFKKIGLQLFTKGDFEKQLSYLLGLEHLSYYINIKLLELSPAGGETNSLNMYLDADTYWNWRMIIKPIKLTLKKLSGLTAAAVILVALIILISLSLFLYKNFYQAVTQTKEILILRQKVAIEAVNLEKFNIIINKLAEKTKPRELKNVKNPFR